uniref:Uncharacterized protein n=1 Tax=Arion vulgaris TaxID=1028688 RepID=A0A0B7A276_9EUPU
MVSIASKANDKAMSLEALLFKLPLYVVFHTDTIVNRENGVQSQNFCHKMDIQISQNDEDAEKHIQGDVQKANGIHGHMELVSIENRAHFGIPSKLDLILGLDYALKDYRTPSVGRICCDICQCLDG